jgi:hypothetical protein
MVRGLSHAIGRLIDYFDSSRDNFNRDVSNPLLDLIDVAGEKRFTPERLRFFKDGERVFIQYGTDPTYSETDQGHLLQPGSGQTCTLHTAEKAAYQVGYDLWPTQSRQINGTLEPGDAVGGGYGRVDLANFDPTAVDPEADNPASGVYTGTDADGYFWYHTVDTGFKQALLALVQNGTVFDSRIVELVTGADIFTIIEQRLNCYAVGPSVFQEISTDLVEYPDRPQLNRVVGAVANDDGQGSAEFSHRASFAVKQGAGNTGLELEAGSVALRTPGTAEPQFKVKGHTMAFDNTNTTLGTYQALGAFRIDTERETVKLRIQDMNIVNTPGQSVNTCRVLVMSTDPANTNADTFTFAPPEEHSETNSVLREVEVAGDAATPMTGPVEDDPGTDATGAVTANVTDNPGGYQIGRTTLTPEGQGTSTAAAESPSLGNRELYPGDIAVIWVDSNTAGIHEVDILTSQNS